MSLAAIRAGVATRLATIVVDGVNLRTVDYVDGQINPPVAVVGWPNEIDYDSSFGRGLDEYTIPFRVYVAGADNRVANDALEGYLAKSGATSVKAAIEAEKTLGGTVSDCRVTRMTGIVWTDVGGLMYLAADWELHALVA